MRCSEPLPVWGSLMTLVLMSTQSIVHRACHNGVRRFVHTYLESPVAIFTPHETEEIE